MSEYITLVGAEEVSRAASSMRSAADDMQRAASSYQYVVDQQQRFMDDWLQRLEVVLSAALSRLTPPKQDDAP